MQRFNSSSLCTALGKEETQHNLTIPISPPYTLYVQHPRFLSLIVHPFCSVNTFSRMQSSTMASTSQSHPAYQSRPYGTSALHTSTKLPDRSAATPLSFGTSAHTHNAREAARLERERLERERAQAAQQQQQQQQQVGTGGGAMAQLNDEQRDEINEAVRTLPLLYPIALTLPANRVITSSNSSTSTKTP
jgi:hypothetical protein